MAGLKPHPSLLPQEGFNGIVPCGVESRVEFNLVELDWVFSGLDGPLWHDADTFSGLDWTPTLARKVPIDTLYNVVFRPNAKPWGRLVKRAKPYSK